MKERHEEIDLSEEEERDLNASIERRVREKELERTAAEKADQDNR